MMIPLLVVIAGLLLALLILVCLLFKRQVEPDLSPLLSRFTAMEHAAERTERSLRDDIARHREETTQVLHTFGDSLQRRMTQLAGLQQQQLDGFAQQLGRLTESNAQNLAAMRDTVEHRLDTLRHTMDQRLQSIQADNATQLENMRATVDEKLQGTLEKRLGESFRQVSERLEQVHQGLGEMHTLAIGVGDLKRVLTNVKTRGVWGEMQLEALLTQILTAEQYARNVRTNASSNEVVEFAIKFPGRGDTEGDVVWLPVDAKFPIEDYQRLLDAHDRADVEAAQEATRYLALRIKNSARDICQKYLNPPYTTDFGILFLPIEGLYAEVARQTGLLDIIQRECRVVIAGPTTFAALLNSLQMGFRTLAIERRSSEVATTLSAVKTEFGKFSSILEGVKKRLEQASKTMDDTARRSRAIERQLRHVQELPLADTRKLFPDISLDDV